MVLNFESVDKILWWDHSNETSSIVLSHGTTVLIIEHFTERNLGLLMNFDFRQSLESKG